MIDSARITQYFISGIRLDILLLSALIVCIPTSFLGAYIAKKLVDKIPQQSFRFFVLLALLLVGLRYLFLFAYL